MRANLSKSLRLSSAVAFATLLTFSVSCQSGSRSAAATATVRARPAARVQNVNGTPISLTAQRMSVTLPDGTPAPMWGFCETASCATSSAWTPGPTIYATAGETVQITLTNALPVPTSLVVLGQLGGGLGSPVKMDSPAHAGQNYTTFPNNAQVNPLPPPNGFVPPAQAQRVRSFGTEVAAAGTNTLTYGNLKPGTYLYETGTLPSLQVPMGLYGVLVVTAATSPATPGAAGTAYPGVNYDADTTLLFSEIDVAQNTQVDLAAQFQATHPTTDITNLRFNDAACAPNCYPAAVNYAPTYFLINGQWFDKTHPEKSEFDLANGTSYAAPTGNLMVRLLNAGSRTHIPSIVNLPMALVAEDGNLAKGNPRVQSEVLLTAGKTYDAVVHPVASGNAYAAATYPVFDRSLSLSTNNHADGGMQGFILVNAAAATGTCSGTTTTCSSTAPCGPGSTCVGPGFLPAAVVPTAVNDSFKVPYNSAIIANVTANDISVISVALNNVLLVQHGSLALSSNGSFTYTPTAGFSGTDSFTYYGNGNTALTATVTLNVAAQLTGAANTPVAANDSYTSAFTNKFSTARPGVLANDTDPNGFPLTAGGVSGSTCASVTLNADGSFSVTGSGAFCTFSYVAINSQGTNSVPVPPTNTGTVTVNFGTAGATMPGLAVSVADATTGTAISDYRWTLQEDLTFKHDVNGTPSVSTRTVGTSFHRSHMPVVATGCVGPISCGSGQSIRVDNGAIGGAIAAVSESSGTVTVRTAIPQNTQTATQVVISNISPAGYNGSFPITWSSSTLFTYQLPTASGGTYSFTSGTNTITGTITTLAEVAGTVTITGDTPVPASVTQVTVSGIVPDVYNGTFSTAATATGFTYTRTSPSIGSGSAIASYSTNANGTLGGRHVVTDAEALALQTTPAQVALDPSRHYYVSILPGDAGSPPGHAMGGGEVKLVAGSWSPLNIKLQASPLVTAQMSIYIYEDNNPTNGANDGTVEPPLGGFNIILMDPAGRTGDVAGQQSYDAFNMPLSNALLGKPGCPDDQNTQTNGSASTAGNLVGAVYTCPSDPNYGTPQADGVKYALAGHALIKNLTPARYDVIAHPGAAREAVGETWWQTETLEGTPAQDAFVGVNEPGYFQEFGPPGPHTTIGFVNPAHVAAYAAATPGLTGTHTITGKITSQHMSHPSDVTLWDSGGYDLLSSTTCQVVLNSQGGTGPAIASAQCDPDGNFVLSGVPAGDFEVEVFDQWLDQIIQAVAVSVPAATATVAMGDIPVLSWFTQYDQNIFMDLDGSHMMGSQPGISNVPLSVRFRNGAPAMTTLTDSTGNGLLVEMFPLFNWYVAEADTTRFKQTGVHVYVDGGGQVDASGPGARLWSSNYAYPPDGTTERVESPGSLTYGLQSFISQRNRVEWGRAPYLAGENGGIVGTVVYSSTRPFDDMRLNVQTIWEPLVPRVQVNLYQKRTLPDGTDTLALVDTTTTTSFDDFVNLVKGADGNNYLLGTDGTLRNPATGAAAPTSAYPAGIQVNLQCPGQKPDDPFVLYTLGAADRKRCYDGWHDWNQVQGAPYDGRFTFPSAAYIAAHPLTAAQTAAGQTLVSLPPGKYVVEEVTPPGYQVVKEEDKNILIGDAFVAPVTQQFGSLASIFIIPDQATLGNANTYNPSTGDPGFQSDPTSNLGVYGISNSAAFPDCVGNPHRVPDYLSLFPQAQQVAPFAGMDRPLCDRKLVALNDQQQASAAFFVFTEVPVASNNTGIILDDASSEFNAVAPDFGEKASVPFVPVSIKDFTGLEISRTYSDQWGAYNMMTPSSWLVNPPTPSGYGPNMLVVCINDPGPVTDPASGAQVTDPHYNPAYSNFCYTVPFMPGQTTYLDTPVLPIAAFAAGYNPADCAQPDQAPAILRVDSSAGLGPWLPATGGTLTILAQGDQQVPNPAYAGPFASSGLASMHTITRHYGFGATAGSVRLVTTTLNPVNGTRSSTTTTLAASTWGDGSITVAVPALPPLPALQYAESELVITTATGQTSVDTVTVTRGGSAPIPVRASAGQTIQGAIDLASPGDLIMIDAGTYNELVIMSKPVRLQGVGAASVIINAAKYPTSKLETWRASINRLFNVDPVSGNQIGPAQVDPLPTQEITGGVIILEPSVLGSEEGPGITVLAKNLPASQCGNVGTVGFDSNFLCALSRIDGLSVTGGDAGGGIYVNGWAHNLEISNNRVYGNAGAYNGGVRVGVPYLELEALPAAVNGQIPGLGYDENVWIHHNAITKNGTVEAPLGNGGAGGGVSICSGTDNYSVDHNYVCGNYSSADGAGIGHLGFSQAGTIASNQVLFNQSFQQSGPTNGGGIFVGGEPPIAGAVSLGTGDVTIDANLIRGNLAEVGQGGGIRLQQVNGADIAATLNSAGNAVPGRWHKITVTNNMIVNNVAGFAGGGISLADTLRAVIDGNTVASNDSTGTAGSVLAGGVALPAATPGKAGVGYPSPSGIVSEPTSGALLAQLTSNGQRTSNAISQPVLQNNIVWQNRSFYYSGDGRLCVGNSTPVGSCTVLPDQSTTGQCVSGARYWEMGVLGDAGVSAGTVHLNPTYTVMSPSGASGYAGAGNATGDPRMVNQYCNGSRVTPELGGVINPPSVLNLQVAATVDEGNNFVNVRYGPLYTAKPENTAGAAYVAFGDYHLAQGATTGNSSAFNHGTSLATLGSPYTHDFDGDSRPQGTTFDIGADELAAGAAASADLGITKSDGVAYVFPGGGVTYAIVVTNYGPGAVTGARVNDALPTVATPNNPANTLNLVTWTCVASPGSSCTTTSGTGSITNRLVNLANGGTATFTMQGTVPNLALTGPTRLMTNTATVAAPTGTIDANQANNSATDTDTVVLQAPVSFTGATLGTLSGTTTRTLAFGNLSGPQTSTVTLTVGGAAPVTFGTATVGNTIGTAFTKGTTDTCSGTTVNPGGTCSIQVNFNAPTNTSARTGTLSVPDNAAGSPQVLNLTGS